MYWSKPAYLLPKLKTSSVKKRQSLKARKLCQSKPLPERLKRHPLRMSRILRISIRISGRSFWPI